VHVAVGPPLRAHVVQVIGGGELAPVFEDVVITGGVPGLHRLLQPIQLGRRILLHRVAQPGGQIPLGVRPGDGVGNIVLADRLIPSDRVAGRAEIVLAGVHIEDLLRQNIKELKDAGVFPLMLAQGFVVHEQVAEVAVAVDLIHPPGESLGGERPLRPVPIRKAEGDVVAEPVVLQKQLDAGVTEVPLRARRHVDVVR